MPRNPPPPHRLRVDRVAIVIPARDEQPTICQALASIARAVEAVGRDVVCHITVVDDGSVDGTGAIAARVLSELDVESRVIRIDENCVGAARRIGVDATTSTWKRPERAWVLSTDADSRVQPEWIARHLEHARAGARAVSGIVDIVADEHRSPLHARWWADYGAQIDRHHRHPYAHATNLGIRLDAYRSVGGFAELTGGEDGDLWRRLREHGIDPVSDARIVVATSDRRIGRVRVGFAHALASLYPDPAVGSPAVGSPTAPTGL